MPRCSFLAVVTVLAVTAAPLVAVAEDADALREARERFDHGVSLYDEGDFEAALAEFLRAYEIAPNYAVLFNIGQAQAQLRRYPEAVASFERYLEEGGDGVPARRRREVEGELARVRRLVGRILVTTDPRAEASVYVDGTEVGRIPSDEAFIVSAGQHDVEVRAEGYLAARRSVTVAGGAEVVVDASLTPSGPPGGVLVSVSVPYATVFMDGREIGTTPLAEPIVASEGRHVIEVRRDGYEPAFSAVEVASGEVARAEVRLQPLAELPDELAGQLAVEVNADRGVRFLLDGAPLPEGVVPIGPHRLEVRLEGFEPWEGDVDVARGEPTRVEVQLRPTEGFLESYQTRANGIRITSYVMAGLAVAMAGTAVGLLVWNDGRYGDWESEDSALRAIYRLPPDDPARPDASVVEARQDDNNALWSSISTVDIVGWVLVGVGVAAAATWAGLFFGGPDPGRYSRVALLPRPDGLGLAFVWP